MPPRRNPRFSCRKHLNSDANQLHGREPGTRAQVRITTSNPEALTTAHNLAGNAVVAMLALAMGIQNAMVRVHGVPDLATNVMTVTFTGIFADCAPAGGTNTNWRRRVASVGLFSASAALGGFLLRFGAVWPLVLASVVFSVAMIPLMFGKKP